MSTLLQKSSKKSLIREYGEALLVTAGPTTSVTAVWTTSWLPATTSTSW